MSIALFRVIIVISCCFSGFIAFSSMPQLAEKIKLFFVLAPLYTFHHVKGPVLKIAFLPDVVLKVHEVFVCYYYQNPGAFGDLHPLCCPCAPSPCLQQALETRVGRWAISSGRDVPLHPVEHNQFSPFKISVPFYHYCLCFCLLTSPYSSPVAQEVLRAAPRCLTFHSLLQRLEKGWKGSWHSPWTCFT